MSSPERLRELCLAVCVAVQEQCVFSVCGIACVPVPHRDFGSAHRVMRHLAALFQLMFMFNTLPSEQTMSPSGLLCCSLNWWVQRAFCDPLSPGTPGPHPSTLHPSHQRKPLTTISQSFWEKQKENNGPGDKRKEFFVVSCPVGQRIW